MSSKDIFELVIEEKFVKVSGNGNLLTTAAQCDFLIKEHNLGEGRYIIIKQEDKDYDLVRFEIIKCENVQFSGPWRKSKFIKEVLDQVGEDKNVQSNIYIEKEKS